MKTYRTPHQTQARRRVPTVVIVAVRGTSALSTLGLLVGTTTARTAAAAALASALFAPRSSSIWVQKEDVSLASAVRQHAAARLEHSFCKKQTNYYLSGDIMYEKIDAWLKSMFIKYQGNLKNDIGIPMNSIIWNLSNEPFKKQEVVDVLTKLENEGYIEFKEIKDTKGDSMCSGFINLTQKGREKYLL